ncbi:MAG: hypothetical protein NTW95_01450 [Candidatus Aminicenantes bacterium]|nr:hypothetical protein [Candidatus Aminicenantes bacterium]
MIRATPNSERSTPDLILTELLSIDADAHLQKLTANMFPSPALLPVELVRSALKRAAAAISIRVDSERIEIADDGAGIGCEEWRALACLGNGSQDAVAREKAMASLQDAGRPGIGLLAVFCPGIRAVQIENSGQAAKGTLSIAAGRSELRDGNSWPRGTRITIRRRRGPAAEERALLAELCAAAAVAGEIVINGRPLKKKQLLKDCLVSLGDNGGKKPERSRLAVPAQGDVCRIWLLDQGIPWQVLAVAPVQGMVFTAALETDSVPAPPAIAAMAAGARRLYRWLAENYDQFPDHFQSRIEDLLFRQARTEGDYSLLSLCAPFRLRASSRRLSLAEVRHAAAKGALSFTDNDSRAGRFSVPGKNILLLSARQKDFLINHLGLPLVPLNANAATKAKPHRKWGVCRRALAGIQKRFAPAVARIINASRLSEEENVLCRELEKLWQQKMAATTPAAPAITLSVGMVGGRGLAAAFRLKNRFGETLLIKRRHPLTRLALQKITLDRDNRELAFIALMPVHPLTDSRH